MDLGMEEPDWNQIKEAWPDKFSTEGRIFKNIHPGDRIFLGTGCGEPQYLARSLVEFVERNPTAFFDAELIQVVTLGVAPYTEEKFKMNFRLNSFFIGKSTRDAVNRLDADYTPIFLSSVPDLFRMDMIPIDIALIQTTPPDRYGEMSLGVSVDIIQAAVERSSMVIAQANSMMPWVNGTTINIEDLDCVVPYNEPIMEYIEKAPGGIIQQIGEHVSRIVDDGSTIQVGYGSIPNAVLSHLGEKKHLGIHTELLSDGIVNLMKRGVIDNAMKSIDRYKSVATFCMGSQETYEYIHRNPAVEFRPIDYTNNPLIIAKNRDMTAINSALAVDLTGQATAETLGQTFYSGVGGQADFMRGAVLSPGGRTILALPSTAEGGNVSRIVPALEEGAGVTLTRGDIQYVVTEYGIAYLHGKNIRQRAIDLIAIAHPKFRPWLVEEAKRRRIIYSDQAFIPGESGVYPADLETCRTTRTGLTIRLRPVKISDEQRLKDFLYDLSEDSIYQRFISARREIPRKMIQDISVIDYSESMVILAVANMGKVEIILGIGQYMMNKGTHLAEIALVVGDECQNQGVGLELLNYLTHLAKRKGLLGFTAEVLMDNEPVFRLFQRMGFGVEREIDAGVYQMKLTFKDAMKDGAARQPSGGGR